jgi:protocatechuate 3,4-dioxygenase beta subunit
LNTLTHHQEEHAMDHDHHTLFDDVAKMLATGADRRQSLRWLLAGAASVSGVSCGGGGGDSGTTASTTATATSTTTTTTTTTASSTCAVIPEETGGPYPADGTNSAAGGVANALILSGIVRSDIRASVAGATGVAQGVPLTIKLKIVNVGASCAAAAGATVYLWHCDRDGNYSMYSSGVTGENYLRGVQSADSNGDVTFTTIFPGCYAGRMPHVHFEVYPTLAKATLASNRIKTSQFTFPAAINTEAYTATGYTSSVRNLANISLATDNVFSDGVTLQTATVTGTVSTGYVATLQVGVSL